MTDERAIELLTEYKQSNSDDIVVAVDLAINAIKSKRVSLSEITKLIDKEKEALNKFDSNDFNHHLWTMRGLQVAKQILEGAKHDQF